MASKKNPERKSGGGSGNRKIPSRKTSSRSGSTRARAGARPKYTPAQIRRNRIIALGIIVLLVAAIIGIVLAIRAGLATFGRWQQAQAAEAKAYQLRMEERTFDPPQPCPGESLQISLTHPAPLIYVGTNSEMEFEVRNSGKTACTVVIDPKKVGVQIVSGNQIVYNSTHCQGEKSPTKQLLLGVNKTWKQTLSWDGMVQNADCSPSQQVARAGTYRSKAIWEGAPIGSETVLALQDPPPPPPEAEKPDSKPRKTTG